MSIKKVYEQCLIRSITPLAASATVVFPVIIRLEDDTVEIHESAEKMISMKPAYPSTVEIFRDGEGEIIIEKKWADELRRIEAVLQVLKVIEESKSLKAVRRLPVSALDAYRGHCTRTQRLVGNFFLFGTSAFFGGGTGVLVDVLVVAPVAAAFGPGVSLLAGLTALYGLWHFGWFRRMASVSKNASDFLLASIWPGEHTLPTMTRVKNAIGGAASAAKKAVASAWSRFTGLFGRKAAAQPA